MIEPGTPTLADEQAKQRDGGRGVDAVAVVELLIGFGAAYLAYSRLQADGPAPPSFWGWLALALFCFPLALVNVLAPRLRTRFAAEPAAVSRLPVRLATIDGAANVVWTILGLGVAFTAPAIPLAIFALGLNARGSELVLLPAGAALASGVAGLIMLGISGSHVYKLLVNGDAVVETVATELTPGQVAPLFVAYEPGRVSPTGIAVLLVCRETTRTARRSSASSSDTTSYVYTKRVIHETTLCVEDPFDANRIGPWEQSSMIEMPPDARLSTRPDVYPTIDWGVEISISAHMLPDFRLTFPFQVVRVDPPASDDEVEVDEDD